MATALFSYCVSFVCPFCLLGTETTKSKNSKTNGKKDGSGIAGRKALNDITNKSSLHHPEASVKKRNLPKQDINVKEEMFLHDHKKCIEAQNAAMRSFNLETVLPQDGNRNWLLLQYSMYGMSCENLYGVIKSVS